MTEAIHETTESRNGIDYSILVDRHIGYRARLIEPKIGEGTRTLLNADRIETPQKAYDLARFALDTTFRDRWSGNEDTLEYFATEIHRWDGEWQ